VISASTKIDNFQNPWNAFDSFGGANWLSVQRYNSGLPTGLSGSTTIGSSNYRGEWLQVVLPQSIALSNFAMASLGNVPRDFYMLGSSDSGTTWNLLLSVVDIASTTLSSPANSNQAPLFAVNNSNLYDTYRIVVGRSHGFDIASISYLALNGSTSFGIARFGVGTSNPRELMSVSGKIYTTTQVISTSNDSATVPSFSFLEDSNTGMFHPSNDSLGFTTAGTERMIIDDVGNVTVRSNLVVQQRFSMPSLQVVRRTGSPAGTFAFGTGYSNTSFGASIDLGSNQASNVRYFSVTWSNVNEAIRIRGDGRIGIGTTSPTFNLDVNGDAHITNRLTLSPVSQGAVRVTGTGDTRYYCYNGGAVQEWLWGQKSSTSHNWILSTLNTGVETDRFTVDTNGNVGIGTTSPAYRFDVIGNGRIDNAVFSNLNGFATVSHSNSATAANYAFGQSNEGTTFINSATGRSIIFRHNNTNQMLLSNGNLGIGTTSPSVRLDVSGSTRTVGTLTVASGGGVSNADVLKAIVSLIASINKQIAALQKALLKR
jgi:hypothetical protein